MDPFGDRLGGGVSNEAALGNRCQIGAEIILKRLFKKLFNQVDALQPSELDEEFIYQSSITYDDYLTMVKQVQEDQISCASLNRLENIFSNLMLSAVVRRPMHTSFANNLWISSGLLPPMNTAFGDYAYETLNLHLLVVLFIVGLTTWFLNHVAGVRSWRAMPLGVLLVGFVEFCMHKNELTVNHRMILERCKNPSMIARIFSWVNYDYDGCNSGGAVQKQNIAFAGVEYLSELIFQPVVHFGEKLGKALQSYLNSFTGVNYLLAPLFPLVLIFVVPLMVYFVFLVTRNRQHVQYIQHPPSPNKAISNSPRKKNSNNNNMTHKIML